MIDKVNINNATMEELVKLLNEASDAYYNDKEIMSDNEFDALFDRLKTLEREEGRVLPNSPTRNVGAPVVDTLPKFKHPYPAKSLDKTKDIHEIQKKFINEIRSAGLLSNNPQVVVMYKEDGSTGQAYYNNGRLSALVTRGNGEIGSVVTHNARYIEGLPLTIPYKDELVVRGEVLMSYDDFKKINDTLPEEEKYKNPRNLAAASLSLLNSEETKERHLHFKAFNLVHITNTTGKLVQNKPALSESFESRLSILEYFGFDTVEREIGHLSELDSIVDYMTSQVAEYPFPVDGLVVAYDNYAYTSTLEGTEHHPHVLSGYAFKWKDETVTTILKEIEWSPSRTGLLNPVAIFEPVELYGTTVSRASIHNLSILKELGLHIGDRIEVTKANMVIPYIESNLDKDMHSEYTIDELQELVDVCPTCGEKIVINKSAEGVLTAYCPNDDCPEKMIGKLAHFCSRDCMDIQGMSEETIKKLVDAGFIKEYADFFTLNDKPGISFLPGFGKQSWTKLYEAAEKARKTTFVQFITALGITNIGKGQAKVLFKFINANYDKLAAQYMPGEEEYLPASLFRWMALKNFDFSQIEGFGKITSNEVITWAHDHWVVDSPETRVFIIVDFVDLDPRTNDDNKSALLDGRSFCITGKLVNFPNRDALVAVIEENGGKFVSSVSSKTDYLINNDTTSTSGKNKKAKELNIPILSEEDFLQMIGG